MTTFCPNETRCYDATSDSYVCCPEDTVCVFTRTGACVHDSRFFFYMSVPLALAMVYLWYRCAMRTVVATEASSHDEPVYASSRFSHTSYDAFDPPKAHAEAPEERHQDDVDGTDELPSYRDVCRV